MPCLTRVSFLVPVLASFVPTPCFSQAADDANDQAMLQYIAQGYRAHLDKFAFAHAKMKLTEMAFATSAENALSGKWLDEPEPIMGDILWVMDGETTRADRIYPDAMIEKYTVRSGGRVVSRRLVSQFQLRNSRIEVLYYVKTSAHLASVGYRTTAEWSPFNYGTGPPLDAQIRKHKATYEGEQELNGKKLPVIGIEYPPQRDRVWIDPDLGYTPVRIESRFRSDKEAAIVTVPSNFTAYPGERWVAHSLLQVTRIDHGAVAPYSVRGWTIEELDVQERPQPQDLQIRVPPNTWISNSLADNHPGYRTTTGVIDLQAFTDQGELRPGASGLETRSDHVHPTPTTPAENQWPFAEIAGAQYRWAAILVLVVAVVAIVTFLYRRRRSG